MRVLAILNADGGTLKTTDLDELSERAKALFEAEGHTLEVRTISGKEVVETLEAIQPGEADVLLAGGGDGTISAAAACCHRTGIALGVLPAGTMNLFARSLQIPLALEDALPALAGGTIRRVDVGTANGRLFVHQLSLGFHVRMLRYRDKLEYASRVGKIFASVRALVATLARPPSIKAIFQIEGTVKRGRYSTISVANNLFGEGHLPYADRLDGGHLALYLHPRMSYWGGVRLVWDAMFGRLADNESVEVTTAPRVKVRLSRWRRRASVVMDGEMLYLDRNIDVRCHPGALSVLVPPEAIGVTLPPLDAPAGPEQIPPAA